MNSNTRKGERSNTHLTCVSCDANILHLKILHRCSRLGCHCTNSTNVRPRLSIQKGAKAKDQVPGRIKIRGLQPDNQKTSTTPTQTLQTQSQTNGVPVTAELPDESPRWPEQKDVLQLGKAKLQSKMAMKNSEAGEKNSGYKRTTVITNIYKPLQTRCFRTIHGYNLRSPVAASLSASSTEWSPALQPRSPPPPWGPMPMYWWKGRV